MLDPRSPQLGSTTDQKETKHNNEKVFIELPLELGCVICTGIIGTCKLKSRKKEERVHEEDKRT